MLIKESSSPTERTFFGILRGAEFTTDRGGRPFWRWGAFIFRGNLSAGRERNREVKVVGAGLAREVKRVKGKSRNWSKDFSLEASYGFEERSPKSESLSP